MNCSEETLFSLQHFLFRKAVINMLYALERKEYEGFFWKKGCRCHPTKN